MGNDISIIDMAAVDEVMAQTTSPFQFQILPRNSNPKTDDASELTRGDCLAGNPLKAARQNRLQKNGSQHGPCSMDIRSLLRFYRTYEQESCLSQDDLEERRLQVPQQRPCTPDVRVRPTGTGDVRATGDVQPKTLAVAVKRVPETPQSWLSEECPDVSSKIEERSPLPSSTCHLPKFESEPSSPPKLPKPPKCLPLKLAPIPPKSPCYKSSSFRRIRGMQANVVCKTEDCHVITKSQNNAQNPRAPFLHQIQCTHDSSEDEEPELFEKKENDAESMDQSQKTFYTLTGKKVTVQASSAEEQMMMNMCRVMQGAPRFY